MSSVRLTKKGAEAVDRVVTFFSHCLVHLESPWAGKPFHLLPWELNDLIRPVFGTLKRDGLRQYRFVHVDIAKKNGKSALGAGIGLYMAFFDGEVGARVVSCAGDKYQARTIFDDARAMVEMSPILSQVCTVYKNEIRGPNNSVYEVVSADARTKHGPKYSAIIFDELHTQPGNGYDLWNVITPGIATRQQPLVFSMTTAGKNKAHLWHDLRERIFAKQKNPQSDPTFWGVAYTVPEDLPIDQESTWKLANPSYGVTIKKDYFVDFAARAKVDPKAEMLFRWLHLNQSISTTSPWIPAEVWDQCVLSQAS